MFKKALLITLTLFLTSCAGTIRIAEEDQKGLDSPKKNLIVKPQE